ncbi:MAG: NAD(P)-dependent oxidoreductase [Candidatus Cloacimonetes bacterium 4572_55]|nr:MAG: NAD(P)-dependent oxidoreductase [Candidatus Cloacimonetes bacterium 4572_55]
MSKLLVTGASGKLGKQVMHFMLEKFDIQPNQLIATTRDPKKLTKLSELGVDVRVADFDNPASLKTAFAGAEKLLLVSVDQVGRRKEQHTNAVKAAEKAGIKHIIYTSMPNPETSPVIFADEHFGTENAIRQSTIPAWTILRNNWYFENLLELQSGILASGKWLTATAQGRMGQISRYDLSLAAAAALGKAGEEKCVLTMSGEKSLTVDEMAQSINKVIGTTIDVVHLDDESYKQQMLEFQMPQELAEMLTSFEKHNKAGLSDSDHTEFMALTGVRPMTFVQWLEKNKPSLLQLTKNIQENNI